MPSPSLDPKIVAAVEKDLRSGNGSHRIIAERYGINNSTVSGIRTKAKIPVGFATPKPVVFGPESVEQPEPERFGDVRKLLKGGPKSLEELANGLDLSPKRVAGFLEEIKARGANLFINPAGKYDLADAITLDRQTHEVRGTKDEWTHVFGVTTDNHLCNKHARLDVLNAAYDTFEREGITTVYNCGNWVDGEARFNKTELLTAPGMDNQLDYMIDKWPVKPGIVTHYIAGDDHEGWYSQREGIEIGRYLQYRAENQGRHDLKYLGYAEADVKLVHGTGSAVMRVVHPGGGSSYAISYTDQKRVESYQGGEKPQIELAGHYHKWNHGYPREVHTVQCGCTCDQSLFMRKKKLQAHVGFVIVRIKQDAAGIVTRFAAEWFPWFDRGFYEKRFV